MTFELPFGPEDLQQSLAEVLMMLGETAPVDVTPLTDRAAFAARLTIDGPGSVELVVTAPAMAAGNLALGFFGEISGEADLVDAIGELANLTAGAIKPYLEETWVIGIPDRVDTEMRASTGILEASAAHGGSLVTVRVASLETTLMSGEL